MSSNQTRRICAILTAGILSISSNLVFADAITPEEAARSVGAYVEVCGMVASATYAARDRGKPTFINLNRAFPNHIFTAIIWGSNRAKFSYSPETLKGKRICVQGKVEEYRGRLQIEVYEPSQIRLVQDRPGTPQFPYLIGKVGVS